MKMGKNLARENLRLMMGLIILANSMTMRSQDMENTSGGMENSTRDSGKIAK